MSKYLGDRQVKVHGRGAERRCDCLLVEHSSKKTFCFNEATGVWWCHVCAIGGDVLALHQAVTGLSFPDAARDLGALPNERGDQVRDPGRVDPPRPVPAPDPVDERERERKVQQARDIWRAALPLAGTIGEAYLLGRGGRIPPADGDLRFHPEFNKYGLDGPCLLGRISKAQAAAEDLGLHITWLHQVEGHWARLDRRFLGPKAGGVIRLWPDEAVTTGLAVAEGIETALAGAHAYAPAWACMDAGNLAQFPVLEGVEALTIFADRDESGTGQRAAAACADRWLDEGREIRIFASATMGHDIADEVAA